MAPACQSHHFCKPAKRGLSIYHQPLVNLSLKMVIMYMIPFSWFSVQLLII